MKKRIVALLMLMIFLMALAPGVQGSNAVFFVGVNDSVPMYLPGSDAPYYKGNLLYVPYTVFNSGVGGIAISYNVDKGNLVLFTRAKRLVYDLTAGTVTDEADKVGKVEVVHRNGILFIPVQRAATHFGLSVTMLTASTGSTVLRFTDGSQTLDDATFIRKAQTLISIILEQEGGGQSTGEGQGGSGQQTEQQTPNGPKSVYLAFAADAVSEQTLKDPASMNIYAAFFLTEEQIAQNPELVREIYASGHQIGLTIDADETAPETALQQANEALDRVLFCKSLMVLLPGGAEDLPQYAVFREWAAQSNPDMVIESTETVQFFVCRSQVSYTLQQLNQSGAYMPQLTENTQIPGVSTR